MDSTYIDSKFLTFFHKPKGRTEVTFKFGKNKAEHPHPRNLNLEWSFHKFSTFGSYLERKENDVTLGLHLIFFSLYITFRGLKRYIIHSEETWRYEICFHHWVIWWNFGCEIHSWKSSDGWRQSSFDILDFFFGKMKHKEEKEVDETMTVQLPEGYYQVDMNFADFVRWRTRVPKFIWKGVTRRASIKITPEIPYPGKNDPIGGYSSVSFPAKDKEEVFDHIYQDIKKKRRGNLSYYANENRKIVDNYTYTINGLEINVGRVPVEKRNKEWHPIGLSTSRIADETFRKLSKQEKDFTPAEIVFINKFMGKANSLDFIKDSSKEEIQQEMLEYFRTRNQEISCGLGDASYSVPAGVK